MKLWKFAAISLMLFSVVLSALLSRDMISGGEGPRANSSSSLSSSSSPSSSTIGLRRAARDASKPNSLLREFTALFQSYTEGEVQQLISTLIDRHRLAGGGKRTKRAKKGLKPCSLKELEVSVSELGLGYQSDETLLFHYCSGKCNAGRRNYDLTLEHMKRSGQVKKGKARHKPCCRPTSYDDDFSFLDNNYEYRTIKEVSAKECGCI
ncbi:NRTN protein, partial [Polyodon spathula]|nr:neurturin-like [Polyodon spathula]MBN3270444.1 NRTN protein [Polyodon spathula]